MFFVLLLKSCLIFMVNSQYENGQVFLDTQYNTRWPRIICKLLYYRCSYTFSDVSFFHCRNCNNLDEKYSLCNIRKLAIRKYLVYLNEGCKTRIKIYYFYFL